MLRVLTVFVAFSILLTGAASADRPDPPSLKPSSSVAAARAPSVAGAAAAWPALSSLAGTQPALAGTDVPAASILAARQAFGLRQDRAWSALMRRQYEATDPVVRDLILWIRASEGVPGMTFDEINHALLTLADWPQTDRMRLRAEEIISQSSLTPAARIAWLEASGPVSGAGQVALATALRADGQADRAAEVIRNAWRTSSMDGGLQRTVLASFGQMLSQDDHRHRVDFLLWTGQRTAAEALRPQLTPDYRRLTDARLALSRRSRNVDAAIRAVPDHLQSHPGLLYERAHWRRTNDLRDTVAPLLVQIDGKDVPPAGRSRLWDERAIAIRDDLKQRNYEQAYQLAAPHGMSAGADFAEAEWLAGWIALRLNGDAARGLNHFERMSASVSSPVSLARGGYWTGRANEALGRQAEASRAYEAAAQHDYTFYGQLASERSGQSGLDLGPAVEITPEVAASFAARPVVRAMHLLAAAGEMGLYRTFSHHLDDTLSDAAEIELLARLNQEYGQPDTAVRAGKAGLARGLVAADAAYPVLLQQLSRQPQVEKAFILAITRQESEFNPRARSPVGALGLMQFMPSTARNEARLRGMPYQKSWLTEDPAYNMTLGGLHLDTLLAQFDGSYIMTAAAYNAGPSRPRQWIRDYGDPRAGQIDPVDWIEFVPFSETRNYIHRVLENIQVYRHRLSGEAEEIRLTEDLARGRK